MIFNLFKKYLTEAKQKLYFCKQNTFSMKQIFIILTLIFAGSFLFLGCNSKQKANSKKQVVASEKQYMFVAYVAGYSEFDFSTINFLNIMTYDFYNGWHNVNGHHSNYLSSARPEMDKNSVVNAVEMHVNAGFPVEKINLGIPFYGRIWKGVKAESDQILFNKAETVGMGIDYVDF